jgi:pimeloyl-ACP methyl ester carboxylesterase
MGGMIAQQLAIHHGSRVRGLVLMATTPGLPFGRLPPARSLATLLSMPRAIKKEQSAAAIARLLIPKSEWHRAREIFAGWGELVQRNPLDPQAFMAQFAAAALHFTGGELAHIRCPVEIVTGDSDLLIPPQNSRKLAEQIRDAHLHVLKNVGHAIPSQDKEIIGRLVASLIDRVEHASSNAQAASRKVA